VGPAGERRTVKEGPVGEGRTDKAGPAGEGRAVKAGLPGEGRTVEESEAGEEITIESTILIELDMGKIDLGGARRNCTIFRQSLASTKGVFKALQLLQ